MRKQPLTRPRALLAWIAAAGFALGARGALASPFTSKGTQPGLTYAPIKASTCQTCHGDYDPAHHIEPWPTWAGSMMAHASRDPLFWAALDVANHDLPSVGTWCLRCHVPEGWLAGRSEPPTGTEDGCALAGQVDARNADFEGVACHVCHRMMRNPAPPPGEAAFYLENAQFWLDDTDCGGQGEPCRRAQYDYPVGGPATPPPHPWAFSSYHVSSELCGTCHNVTHPGHNLLVGGVDQGIPFPIERTYREWLLSDFAFVGSGFASCQDCHMPTAAADPAYACAFQTNVRTGAMAAHQLAGGNAWIPDVLRAVYPALGLDGELAATRDAALAMLQQRSATVEVLPAGPVLPDGTATVSVRVTNLTGHKLPTGYPEGRRMWLHVEARDANDALLWESGAYDPATGVLTRDPQIKVYEAKQGVWNAGTGHCETTAGGADLFHFAKNDCVLLDNRIPPLGFLGGGDLETNPVGYTYPEASPGVLANFDLTSYTIPIPSTAISPVTVRATLRYQTTSKEYVDFLDDQATTHGFAADCLARSTGPIGVTRARFLKNLWQTHGRAAPVDMTLASAAVEVRPADPFDCYLVRGARGTHLVAPAGQVALADPLATGTFRARRPRALCPPSDVGGGRLNATTHAETYPLHALGAVAGLPARGLTVTDQFGSLTLDALRADALLVPTAVDASVPPAPPAPSALDAFTCYRVRTSAGSPRLPKGRQVTSSDAFTSVPMALALTKLRSLCFATSVGGGSIQRPDARLLCYQAKPAVPTISYIPRFGLELANAVFGSGRVDTGRQDVVCLPATVAP